MNSNSSRILIAGLISLWLLPLNAQNITYTTPGGMKMGFGLGSSRQVSDIKNSEGFGFDYWLGTPLYRKENAFLALDWRFRFLAGYNRAYDHRINTDGTYSNIQFTHFNYDLELLLTLNRLRERTRIILSGFAGAGITHGITSADLMDASNNLYDYSSILPNREPSEILADLDQLTDKDFETRLQGRAAVLPTAGIYLGYAFTPHFALGLEYKMNFSLSEHNSAFGMNMDNRVQTGTALDWNSYTSVVFKWALGGGSAGSGSSYTPEPVPTTEKVTYAPQVEILDPYANPYETTQSSVKVTARINNIPRKEDVRVTLNGQEQDFSFYYSISRVEINTELRTGSNFLIISCQTDAGSDRDDLTINYEIPVDRIDEVIVEDDTQITYEEPEQGYPPDVHILQPYDSPARTYNPGAEIRAEISNVDSYRDISLSINGITTSDFSYNRSTNILTATIPLNPGSTSIRVRAQNSFGSESDSRTIIREIQTVDTRPIETLPCSDPVISFFISESEPRMLNGTVQNVPYQRDIRLTVDGRPYNDWQFAPVTGEIRARLELDPGNHSVDIRAVNECGSDRQSKSFFIEAPCVPPSVTLNISAVNAANATHQLSARIQNIRLRENVTLMVNGAPRTDFRFNPTTGMVTATLNMDPGTNHIMVVGVNECGSGRDSKTIAIEAPCILPSVSMTISEAAAGSATHQLNARVQNVSLRSNITLTVNGTPQTGFRFSPSSGQLSASLSLNPGSNVIVVSAKNDCGGDSESGTVRMTEPCVAPTVSFTVSEVNTASTTHQLRGRARNVTNQSQVALTVNGRPESRFQFTPSTGEITSNFRFAPGTQTIVVMASNECGSDSESKKVQVRETVEEEPVEERPVDPNTGWVRINPGNSAWEFCMQTSRGTFNRDNFSNPNFSYTGTASSLYLKPIAGGGTAIVNGKSFNLNPGRYYLFRGSLKVQVTNKHQGAMGQWSVRIESSAAPKTGTGNNRPKSPCESEPLKGNPNRRR